MVWEQEERDDFTRNSAVLNGEVVSFDRNSLEKSDISHIVVQGYETIGEGMNRYPCINL